MNDLNVKVYRYVRFESGHESYNGWFYSKVYAIRGNRFLVYDDGMSGNVPPHFEWVYFDESYHDICSGTYHYIVELDDREDETEVAHE